MATLHLIKARARGVYLCAACNKPITRGAMYFRHDPHPQARRHRGETTSHWCQQCIVASDPDPADQITGRIRVPALEVIGGSSVQLALLEPLRVELIGIGRTLSRHLADHVDLIHTLTPEQFEEVICDRLSAMGLEPQRVGTTYTKDGGVDVVFWPRTPSAFPFLGAAQIKHHRDPSITEGPSTVRDFAGALAGQPFNAGIIVTNTAFSPDAKWFARERAKLIRLRDFIDIRRWLIDQFTHEAEWREIPSAIELCPGVVVTIR